MGLFSMLGKFLFAWFFIVAALQTSFMFEDHETIREDYVGKVSGFMDFLERYFEVTSTGKVNLNMALCGALLFLKEMRWTIQQIQWKKKTPKSKFKFKSKFKSKSK